MLIVSRRRHPLMTSQAYHPGHLCGVREGGHQAGGSDDALGGTEERIETKEAQKQHADLFCKDLQQNG